MEVYEVLLPLACILAMTTFFGIMAKKIGLPSVIGMLLTGILISLLRYVPGVEAGTPVYDAFFSEEMKEHYELLAKIGVVLIMFSAGLGTDLKKIKATGGAAMVITTLGVIFPMGLGFLVAFLFDYFTPIAFIDGTAGAVGEVNLLSDLFYGAILTATSVSITVATLKELGRLNSNVGTAIVAAAVIDDIIGIVILSVLTGLNASEGSGEVNFFTNPAPWMVIVKILLFFLFAVGVGLVARKFFRWFEKRFDGRLRVAILAIAFGFFYAYVAEKVFGVAEITGAYLAGIMLCGMRDSGYEGYKADTLSLLIFTPIFFANIGIQYFDFSSFGGIWLAFGLAYVAAAVLGKFIGCGAGGLLCKFSVRDSAQIGAGMMVRAEVVLVCAKTGLDCGLVSQSVMTYICVIIIFTSFLVPVLLKVLMSKEPSFTDAAQ